MYVCMFVQKAVMEFLCRRYYALMSVVDKLEFAQLFLAKYLVFSSGLGTICNSYYLDLFRIHWIRCLTYRISSWPPASWTNLAVGISILECLDQAYGFIHRATHGQIVHRYLPQHATLIDDKETTERMSACLQINAVILADLVRQIGEQWNLHIAQSAFLAWRIDPGQVCKVRVNAGSNYLRVNLAKFRNAIRERDYLGGTNECAVELQLIITQISRIFLNKSYKSKG